MCMNKTCRCTWIGPQWTCEHVLCTGFGIKIEPYIRIKILLTSIHLSLSAPLVRHILLTSSRHWLLAKSSSQLVILTVPPVCICVTLNLLSQTKSANKPRLTSSTSAWTFQKSLFRLPGPVWTPGSVFCVLLWLIVLLLISLCTASYGFLMGFF